MNEGAARGRGLRAVVVAAVAASASGCDAQLAFEEKVGCEVDADCTSSSAPRCDTSTRTCVRCLADVDCPLASLHCEPIGHVCVECVDDGQCTRSLELRRCDTALHRCVGCGSAADCRFGDTCEPTTRRCVPPCAGGFCLMPGATCDKVRNVCVDCAVNADCRDKERRMCEPASGRCVQCTTDAQCGVPRRHCDRLLGRCVGCRDQGDCLAGTACDPATRTCVTP